MTKRTDLDEGLRQLFGFDSFRPNQEEIVRALLAGRDVLAVMPTGGGKSLCYQLPATILPGVCVVVSPLLSLMKDQVDAALEIGIAAASLNSTTAADEFAILSNSVEQGRLDLLYVSPERFNSPNFLPWLKRGRVAFFAVDEAHCISQWGHHFRPDYLGLANVVHEFPDVPVAAFTATATEFVADDILKQLGLRNPFYIRASFDRPNLFYRICPKENGQRQLLSFLKEVRGESGIVYRGTRKKVEETAEFLIKQGFKAGPYHAGMTDAERSGVQDAFARDEIEIVVATVAFGMGIDKSNVRFVVHADLAKNIESYYQETGRAGRDGIPAKCLLLFGYQDVLVQRSFLKEMDDEELRQAAGRQLDDMIQFAEADRCRRKTLLAYFGEDYVRDDCGACDFCLGEVEREDATVNAQKALSAVVRTKNRFGAAHLIDILTGAETEKITRYRHDELPTYGVGKDRQKNYWQRLFKALVLKGALEIDPNAEFTIPKVTEFGWTILRGAESFELLRRPDRKEKKERKKRRRDQSHLVRRFGSSSYHDEAGGEVFHDEESLETVDRVLFDILRARRRELAAQRGVPPYVIFHDKNLLDMIRVRPNNQEEMMTIDGIGKRKADAYGEEFIRLIQDYDEKKGAFHG